MKLHWKRSKPTTPGKYLTRVAKTGRNVNLVVVTRHGRGLSVYCARYNDRVPMSQISDHELEWAEVQPGKTLK
jgi:hypothetical protein